MLNGARVRGTAVALSLLLLATAAPAQPPQLTQAQRERVAALGAALGRCHQNVVRRYVRTPMSASQIVERALAGCASREAPIRAEAVRLYGRERAQPLLRAQRAHYRQMIGRMIAQARSRG